MLSQSMALASDKLRKLQHDRSLGARARGGCNREMKVLNSSLIILSRSKPETKFISCGLKIERFLVGMASW